MAMPRLNLPSVFLYGGTILPGPLPGPRGHDPGRLRSGRRHSSGQDDRRGARELESVACPGAGACGGQYTANTMAWRSRPSGMSAGHVAPSRRGPAERTTSRTRPGKRVMKLLGATSRPRDIMTRQAFENAIASVALDGRLDQRRAALPGHGARGRRRARHRRLRRHQRSARRIIADMKPGGEYVALDLHKAGGMPRDGASACSRRACCDGSAMTVSGRTLGEEAAIGRGDPGAESSCRLDKPMKADGRAASSSRATSLPRAPWSRWPAHERMHAPRTRRASSTREEEAFAAVQAGEIGPATSW